MPVSDPLAILDGGKSVFAAKMISAVTITKATKSANRVGNLSVVAEKIRLTMPMTQR